MAVKNYDEITIAGREFLTDQLCIAAVYQPDVLDRAIVAEVRYDSDDAVVDPVMRHRSPMITIKVPNDSDNGIEPSEFETNQTISIPPRKGADARTFTLARIVKQTAAFVTFEAH